jgi:hypothetical protein
MSDPADKLSAQGPIVASRAERQVQCICDALRAGQRTIVVICRDPHPTRIPDAALAACASSTSRVLRIGRPLPELLELQEIIGAAAGVAGGRGMAPQALARLLQTAEPRQSVVLVIDDADSLPRQSLYYLAQMQMLNVLAMDAPALQIVFAARPALLERLSHPDFETFRNRITLAGGVTEPSLERVQQEGEPVFYPDTRRNKDLEQDNDSKNGDLALGHENTPSIAPRSVQLPPLPTAPRRLGLESGRIAPRPPVAYKAAVVLAMSCLVTMSYVAFLFFSDDPTQSSAPAARSDVPQEFAAAPGSSPSAPLDPRQTDKVIASLIDREIAAAAAGRLEEARRLDQAAYQAARAGVNPYGAPSPQVETALAQARASAPVAADLPAFAPIRAVLTFARDNVARAERTAAIRQALMDAEVEVADLAAVDAQRPRPSIGYYFRSDRYTAVDVSRRLEPLFGAIEPIVLPLRGRVPTPGTIEITVP